MSFELKRYVKNTPIRRYYFLPHRLKFALRSQSTPVKEIFKWLVNSNETSNFTYELTDLNRKYLCAFIAVVANTTADTVESYISEIENDSQFNSLIKNKTLSSADKYVSDSEVKLGRRLGWYALARIKKPKLIVETGVDKGLGSCVLTAALLQNAKEGAPGKYLGTDINPDAGFLLGEPYNTYGKILYGDSIESLKKINEPIDFFINDSDHSIEYEYQEYQAIRGKLTKDATIIGDNSHLSDKLMRFAKETDRKFLFFQETPKNHWYRGAGIGAAF